MKVRREQNNINENAKGQNKLKLSKKKISVEHLKMKDCSLETKTKRLFPILKNTLKRVPKD